MSGRIIRKRRVIVLLSICLFAAVGSYLLLFSHAATPQPVIYITSPPWNFATTAHSKGQFTDAEYNDLANHYQIVIIDKQHNSNDINAVYEAAKELKRRNPNLKIYQYYMSKFWIAGSSNTWVEPGYDPAFQDQWILRDNNNVKITQYGKPSHYFVDLRNPHYRAWVIAQLKHRFEKAPFDGIDFDNSTDIVQGYNGKDWLNLLGQTGIDDYNQGMKLLHQQAIAAFQDKTIVFNGIGANTNKKDQETNPGRSLYKLDYMHGAMNEGFCLGLHSGLTADIPADIGIMQKYSNKKLLLHSNFFPSETPELDATTTGRYCLGAFLMGWQPGSSYWKYAVGENAYTTDALKRSLPEENLNIGEPAGPPQASGSLYQRRFTNGWVYVNIGATPQILKLPNKLIQYENGKELATYTSGASFTLGAQTAAYFLNDSFVHPTEAASTNPTGTSGVGETSSDTSLTTEGVPAGSQKGSSTITKAIPKRAQKPIAIVFGLVALGTMGYLGFIWYQYKSGKIYLGIIRSTYIIDPAGNIVKEYPKVNPVGHAQKIIKDLKTLQKK